MPAEENTITLDMLKPDESAVVQEIHGEEGIYFRLREMGMIAGTPLTIKRLAPMGDPMEISLRGYSLSIRKEDARKITVRKI